MLAVWPRPVSRYASELFKCLSESSLSLHNSIGRLRIFLNKYNSNHIGACVACLAVVDVIIDYVVSLVCGNVFVLSRPLDLGAQRGKR